ncbi:MAG: hypothetical protein M4D80_00725 [Myxococcota bacterium]|nr:hypothetical protein [Deltaproteobacteria bacterium]MDQ3333677.1 hypothetical protein [Myxococcota bacterium]
MGLMPAQQEVPTKDAETSSESVEKPEPKKREEKKRSYDTLSDENPLICRGID